MYKIVSNNFLFIILSVLTFCIVFMPTHNADLLILSIYAIIAQISLLGIFLLKKSDLYSLNKTFHIFTYFFFGLAPALQFKGSVTFYDRPPLLKDTYLVLAVILLFSQIMYVVIFRYSYSLFEKKIILKKVRSRKKINTDIFFWISFFAFLVTFYLFDWDFILLFKQQPVGWQKLNTKHGLIGYSLLLSFRVIPVISFLYYKLRFKEENCKLTIPLLFLVLVTVFPTSLTRSVIAAYYFPIVLLMVKRLFVKRYTYSLVYFVGFMVLFPILNYFRNGYNRISMGFEFLKSAHMDTFQNFGYLFQENIITSGRQLLGSILFFVPESVWKDRPVGTGMMIAEKLNFTHTNIAFPFLGEGFANFGYFGVLLFLVIVAMINSFFDSKYKDFVENKMFFLQILFLYFLSFEFYLLRGDLYSSFKFFSSFFMGLIIFCSFLSLFSSKKDNY